MSDMNIDDRDKQSLPLGKFVEFEGELRMDGVKIEIVIRKIWLYLSAFMTCLELTFSINFNTFAKDLSHPSNGTSPTKYRVSC